MTSSAIRHKLHDFIRIADERKLQAIYILLENEIGETNAWWQDKQFLKELDQRYEALNSGIDKGCTKEQLVMSVEKQRGKKYGK